MILLSFVACDNEQEELEQLKTEYSRFDPYVDLIDALEAGDYTTAESIIDGYQSAAYNSHILDGSIQEISIDNSNWAEFFELAEITQWTKNDFEETTGFVTHVCVVLKDEYIDSIDLNRSVVSFGWESQCSVKNCDVDLENQIVTYENVFKSNSTTFGDPEVLTGTVSFEGKLLSGEEYNNNAVVAKIGEIVIVGEYSFDGQMKPVCFDYDNTTIVNAEGLLTLTAVGE